MFHFYSFLSPKGTPDPAALNAAEELPAHWEAKSGTPVLRLPGVFSSYVLHFCFKKSALFICEPGKIVKIAGPIPNEFWLDMGRLKGLQPPSLLVEAPREECSDWVNARGEPVNLFVLDESFFGDLGAESQNLPLVRIYASDPGVYASTPFPALPKLLWFLKKTEGPLSAQLTKSEKEWALDLTAGAKKFSTRFPIYSNEAKKAEAGVRLLSDGVLSVKVSV